ncbi:MAG: DNA polymerase III subunit delta [Pseudomonadota bacterium]
MNTNKIYLLHGAEQYLVNKNLKSIILSFEYQADDILRYGLDKTNYIDEFLFEASSPSLFSSNRLLIGTISAKLKEADLKKLIDLIQAGIENVTLVFIATKLDKRGKLFSSFKKHGKVIECNLVKEKDIYPYIGEIAKGFKKKIDPQAARYLLEILGNDLIKINNELEKASIFNSDADTITLTDLEGGMASAKAANIFEFTDSIGNKDIKKALKLLSNLRRDNEHPLKILTMVARHIRILIKIKAYLKISNDSSSIAGKVGVHPFYAKNYISQAANFSNDKLFKAISSLSQIDINLKSRPNNSEFEMKDFIIDLAR